VSAEHVERKLAAILAADVAGYSRLMGSDEEGTLALLKAHRKEVIDPKIAEHRGRIVKTTGDGVLIEFPSVVDAVRCAVAVQQQMAERNSAEAQEKRIEFRVGINVGDIIIDGDDIYGDGVNIAARLEGLAEPGGVSISGRVYEDVRDKLDVAFDDIGEQSLKNIARPVRAYKVVLDRSGTKATPALTLPDKPSISILPFQNLSGDPEQEYFADGIVEEITTALSRIRWLFVIARNSSFSYKGKAAIRARRFSAQRRAPSARHRAVDRRDLWRSRLGRALRPRSHRCLRGAGRDHRKCGWDYRAGIGRGRATACATQAAGTA
jgi:adenylate cyclase